MAAEPKAEETKAEAPQAEEAKAEGPRAEVATAEETKADDDSQSTLVFGEAAAEESKAEEAKSEAPQAEEAKAEEAQAQAPRRKRKRHRSPTQARRRLICGICGPEIDGEGSCMTCVIARRDQTAAHEHSPRSGARASSPGVTPSALLTRRQRVRN